MELFKASNQWAERPADERFWDLEEMRSATRAYRDSALISTVTYGDLRVEADSGEVKLLGKTNIPAKLTNWAFGQLAQRVKAPAAYLRSLPATLATQNLNYGLKEQREPDEQARLLLHRDNGGYLARCMTGVRYERIWNDEIVERLVGLGQYGWRIAPARPAGVEGERTRVVTEADCLSKLGGLSIEPGDVIAPAGLYASDRDMFVFMIDDDHVIDNPADPNAALARGFFLWNSEVGDKSIGGMTFLYDAVCGNHIVWGAIDVKEFRFSHVGEVRSRAFGRLSVELREYAESSASDEQAKIARAQSYLIGDGKDEVLEELIGWIGKKRIPLNAKILSDAYDVADRNERYGDPRTPWGVVQGITEMSQQSEYAGQRVQMDRAAGKVMEIAF